MSGVDAMIGALRKLGAAPAAIAKRAAPLVDAAVKKTAAAGTTPDGQPWQPKKDGGRPLVNAANALSTKAVGTTVVVTLEGPEVVHDKGTKRLPQRKILPDGGAGLPTNVADAMREACEKVRADIMGGV